MTCSLVNRLFRCGLLVAFSFVVCQPLLAQTNTKEVAVIETNHGELLIEMWPDVAPKTVENFKKLAVEEFYNGQAFHRIIAGFMVQGGDPLTKDDTAMARWGTGDPGYKIDAEFNDRKHVRGVISMARGPNPNSAGSQFFICLAEHAHLDGQYTAFGKMVVGDDVLTKLGAVETERGDRPVVKVELKSIKFEEREIPEAGDE